MSNLNRRELEFEPEIVWDVDSKNKPFRCSVCSKARSWRANDYLYIKTSKVYYCDSSSCEATANKLWNSWAGMLALPQELKEYGVGNEPSDDEKVCYKKGCLLFDKHRGEHRFSWREVENG